MFNLYVLRRNQKDIEIFGNSLFVDIDGRSVGEVDTSDLKFELSPGTHTIKMYMSRSLGYFVGITEINIKIEENEKIYVKYVPPLIANQAGNIFVSSFQKESELDAISSNDEDKLKKDYSHYLLKENEIKDNINKNEHNLFIWIFVIPTIIGLLYFIIEIVTISSLY